MLSESELRFAHSAPCSPRDVPSLQEHRSTGATFTVRQSPKDGRSRLQLCPSAPEYRSVNVNNASKVLVSNALHVKIPYSRSGTKSLNTTPVKDVLRGEILASSSGLKPGEVKRDFLVLNNSHEPQHLHASGKGAQPHQIDKWQSPTYSVRVEPFVSKTVIVTSCVNAHSYTSPALLQASSLESSGVKPVISIKNYKGNAEITDKVTGKDGLFKKPITRKYGVDESVKLTASEAQRSSEDKFIVDIINQQKRICAEAAAAAGPQTKRQKKTTKKPKEAGESSPQRTGKVTTKRKKKDSEQPVAGSAQFYNEANSSLVQPSNAKSNAITLPTSNFLDQFSNIMNKNQTVGANTGLEKLETGAPVNSAKSLQRNLNTDIIATNLNVQQLAGTSTTAQVNQNRQLTPMRDTDFAAICQYLLKKADVPNAFQSNQPVNASVAGAPLQNFPNFSSLLADATMMTAVSQLEIATYMQYQSKIQQISASAMLFEHISRYINYVKTLANVQMSQVQPSELVNSTGGGQRQQQQFQPQMQPPSTFSNYSFPTTFPSNPFLDRGFNFNSGPWFDYMRLLAMQSSSAGLYMPPATTPLWNPFPVLPMQNASSSVPVFPDLQKGPNDLAAQRNCGTVCENNNEQYPSDLQVAEILASISNMPSSQ